MTGGVVVCLGTTGKNFGAGMSGGIGYIYDLNEDFSDYCNMSLIDVENLSSDLNKSKSTVPISLIKSDMLRYHKERLYYLISRHFKYTRSQIAKHILENWTSQIKKFKVVFPRDYRRALLNINKEMAKKRKLLKG